MRLEELVELEMVDVLLVPVITVELEVVVFVELCEIVDDVAVGEDEIVVVRTDEEADCVTVLLLAVNALLLVDDVPLELPVVVVITGLLEDVEVGEATVVPLVVNTDEDGETEVDEVLLYGAPLEMVLDVIPLEGPVL
jgi:hypothetical protein